MSDSDRAAVDTILVNCAKSIASYVTTFVSRDSTFDRFAEALKRGDREAQAAFGASALRGLRLFLGKANCNTCHHGPLFTDFEFHNIRVPPLASSSFIDSGRYAGLERLLADQFNSRGRFSDDRRFGNDKLSGMTVKPEQWGQFKTPSLRNVTKTSPYMHQGQFTTVRQVIHYYSTLEGAVEPGHHEEVILSPLQLSEQEKADIGAFLETLTDETRLDTLTK